MEDFSFMQLLNPEFYINLGGIYLVSAIIFAETGIFLGFFLPGDSLLFLSGIFSRQLTNNLIDIDSDLISLIVMSSIISLAGIAGNFLGYWVGVNSEHYLNNKKDTYFYKKQYIVQARIFYEKHGYLAIIIARFLPIIRTFAPIVAGIVRMNKYKFAMLNIAGSFLWVFSITFAGHYLNSFSLNNFNVDLSKHIDIIVIVMVAVTTGPVLYKIFSKNKKTE